MVVVVIGCDVDVKWVQSHNSVVDLVLFRYWPKALTGNTHPGNSEMSATNFFASGHHLFVHRRVFTARLRVRHCLQWGIPLGLWP